MLLPIRLGTKRKMFSFVWSSASRAGSLGVPLLWSSLLSAAMIAAACAAFLRYLMYADLLPYESVECLVC